MIIKKILEKKVCGFNGLRTMCEYKCGRYRIKTFLTDGDDPTWTRFEVRYENGGKPSPVDCFAPTIYYHDNLNGDGWGYFAVSTASYGSLIEDTYKWYLKAVTYAGEVVSALNKYFIKEA